MDLERYDRPASARQVSELRRLASRLGFPAPRTDLTADEATVALAGLHKRNDRGGPFPAPALGPEANETLVNWFPYRRSAVRRQGRRLA
jgi:hypothetical protein